MAKRGRKKHARPKVGVQKPRSWDKAVSVALLRLIGATQEAAAQHAGCALRAVTEWEKSFWWKDAMAEARQRWFQGGDQRTMRALYKALDESDTGTARWWADRRIPELAPPSQRIVGADGGAVELTSKIVFVSNDDTDNDADS